MSWVVWTPCGSKYLKLLLDYRNTTGYLKKQKTEEAKKVVFCVCFWVCVFVCFWSTRTCFCFVCVCVFETQIREYLRTLSLTPWPLTPYPSKLNSTQVNPNQWKSMKIFEKNLWKSTKQLLRELKHEKTFFYSSFDSRSTTKLLEIQKIQCIGCITYMKLWGK